MDMSKVLEKLEPQGVFKYFEAMSEIPRGSGNEQAISDYLVGFAKERKLEVIQDKALNVIIKKPGTNGFENAPTVILQGHMDMVCEKNMDTVHDFLKDPLKLVINGDYIEADGTTLGADNGIAVAYCLALLDADHLAHPPLEVVVTTDEEAGMGGALSLDASCLEGKYLINLDSEEEGEFLVSCAGGLKAFIEVPATWEEVEGTVLKVMVKGLKGGHSGGEIDKCRANSNRLLGRILYDLQTSADVRIIDVVGGSKDNAIPREAYAHIVVKSEQLDQSKEVIKHITEVLQNEYKTSDPGLTVVVSEEPKMESKALTAEAAENLVFLLLNVPNGIQTMSADIEGLVESSLNLGVLHTDEKCVKLTFAVRSSVGSLKTLMNHQLASMAKMCDAKYSVTGEYPEWAYRKDSKLRDVFIKTYKDMYGKEPLIKAIHAGLECGVFDEKIEGLDMISLGPNMFDVHTPDERLSISSTKRTWEFFLEALKNIK